MLKTTTLVLIFGLVATIGCEKAKKKEEPGPKPVSVRTLFAEKAGNNFDTHCTSNNYVIDNRLQTKHQFINRLSFSTPTKAGTVSWLGTIDEIVDDVAKNITQTLYPVEVSGVKLPGGVKANKFCFVQIGDLGESVNCNTTYSPNNVDESQWNPNCSIGTPGSTTVEEQGFGEATMQNKTIVRAYRKLIGQKTKPVCGGVEVGPGTLYTETITTDEIIADTPVACPLVTLVEHYYFVPDGEEKPIYSFVKELLSAP